ncbi:MAG TPA: ABC-F family ATP-binding cassette domain-containing protein [Chlamydiales bacterium]|nr:ABC-F family ATP-binding cassette domain-containing protein [Chlamydiales bacterium]
MCSFQLIQFQSLSISFGPKTLFSRLSLTISRGERLALIGENGSGKTTLARLAIGEICPDAGSVSITPGIKIGYLSQNPPTDLAITLEEFLLPLQKRLSQLEEQLPVSLAEWESTYEEFQKQGGYLVTQCLEALKLDHIPLTRSLSSLSGGELRRAQLAYLLLKPYDLLILDEPTNHLDKEAILWLESYLQSYQGALLLISHDRTFINRVANGLLEIQEGSLRYYSGNYEEYLVSKKKELQEKIASYQAQKEEIKELNSFIKGETFSTKKPPPPKDRNIMAYDRRGERHISSKRKKIAQAKSRLEKIVLSDNPLPKYYTGIVFHPESLSGQLPFDAKPGDRIILSGPNGCGKTTLLKNLQHFSFPPTAIVGYLPQEIHFEDDSITPLAYLQAQFSLPEEELRSRLRRIDLFEDRLIHQPISSLSLGQKRRLQLLPLMLNNANVLLLDEPTNHLSPAIIEELEDAIAKFEGLVIAATHDRRFIEKLGTKVISFPI